MKLQVRGANRNHGDTVIHDSSKMKFAEKRGYEPTNKRFSVIKPTDDGITMGFDGTANLSKSSDYEFRLFLSDKELLEIFQMKFGLQTTVLDVQKELFAELLKQRDAAGLPPMTLPALPAPGAGTIAAA